MFNRLKLWSCKLGPDITTIVYACYSMSTVFFSNKYQITSLPEDLAQNHEQDCEGWQVQLFILSTTLWLSVQFFHASATPVICFFWGCVWLHTGRQALPTLQRVCPSNFSSNWSHVVSGKKPGMRTDMPLIYPFNWTSAERDICSLGYFSWRRNMKPESCKNLILMDEVLPWWTQPFRNTVKLTSHRENIFSKP